MNPVRFAPLAALALFTTPTLAQTNTLLPVPSEVTWNTGRLPLDNKFPVDVAKDQDIRVRTAAAQFIHALPTNTLRIAPVRGAALVVHCASAGPIVQSVTEDESYTLDISPAGATLDAPTPLGIVRGFETLGQLIQTEGGTYYLPAAHIHDAPRFAWRGLMVDVSRHFMPVDLIERTLDKMASVKLNVFHWHLSDDQGFRVQSTVFPKLTDVGSEGHFYTQAEVKAIVAYARDRGIRVVPEFDIPGHTTALLAAYPELGSAPGPYAVSHQWGVHPSALDPTNERVYDFLDKFFGEISRLFPDRYVHIGGDEVNGGQWSANAKIQAFMRAHGLADNAALQAYFNGRVSRILQKHGKSMIGWDEILAPGLPASTTVQSWRGKESLATAAREGRFAILSSGYYLDNQISAAQMYANDPQTGPAAALPTADQARILGGEVCMWTERVTPASLETRVWPRAAVVAERLWSPASVTDADDLARRLRVWFPAKSEPQSPYHAVPDSIPGTVEAEDYDRGGEGVAYHDADGADSGEGYRENEAVDVEPFPGGFDVGYIQPGQWLKYTVNVAAAGTYDFGVRVSSAQNGGSLHLEDETGKNLTGPLTAPATGSWDTWTVVHATIKLTQGRHVLKLVEDTGGYNLDSMTFTVSDK